MSKLVDENSVDIKNDNASFSTLLSSKLSAESTDAEINKRKNSRFYYSVGEHKLLLEQDIKAENLPQQTINNLPHSPSWCSGMVNVRGIIIPVVNMHEILNTANKIPKNKTKLLWLQYQEMAPIIFQIDRLPSIIDYNEYKIDSTINSSYNWVTHVISKDTEKIYVVNHKQLLTQIKNSQ